MLFGSWVIRIHRRVEPRRRKGAKPSQSITGNIGVGVGAGLRPPPPWNRPAAPKTSFCPVQSIPRPPCPWHDGSAWVVPGLHSLFFWKGGLWCGRPARIRMIISDLRGTSCARDARTTIRPRAQENTGPFQACHSERAERVEESPPGREVPSVDVVRLGRGVIRVLSGDPSTLR